MELMNEKEMEDRLKMMQSLIAKPIPKAPWTDPYPSLIEGGCVLIGNKYHAADIPHLIKVGVTAVLNCASGGISRLPVEELKESGIQYTFTNVNQDDYSYPILHDKAGNCSKHLEVAKALYGNVKSSGGKVLFFCVAGQNRSAALAVAVMMLFGHPLQQILATCSTTRPFVLENVGFQRQIVQLEAMLKTSRKQKISGVYIYGTPSTPEKESSSTSDGLQGLVEIELLIPGLCTMDVKIPVRCTIAQVKKSLVDYANRHLLVYSNKPAVISKSWIVLAMFGFDSMYDFPLEVEAIERGVQIARMKSMFGLHISDDGGESIVQWTDKCRFALVIFSVDAKVHPDGNDQEIPWTFVHEERPGAPATFLANTLMNTTLRAWDFVTGQAFCSHHPIVFSFSDDPRDKRQFMKISTSAHEAQQFHAPGEGGILGMGANAIVHRVGLKPTSDLSAEMNNGNIGGDWDAAVKRPFSLQKMLGALKSSSEAGMAKRLRFANSMNSDGRVLFFYGLGVALSANAANQNEYKFEATILARYEEEFSTYTMKRFVDDYTSPLDRIEEGERTRVGELQKNFCLIDVKILLVSLLSSFRDLTLMGVQAFDFNHMNNVLVSRDHRRVHLIDIDGGSKGSIQFPSEYIHGSSDSRAHHKPSLDIDLNTLLPTMVIQLVLGKGRGDSFVSNKRSEIWRASPEDAKSLIRQIIHENFFGGGAAVSEDVQKHIGKVTEWFYTVMKKASPWDNWTHDIYDAMRCIDHLPVS